MYHADVQMDRSQSVLLPTQGLRDERGGKDVEGNRVSIPEVSVLSQSSPDC
jgi:hypothetical protein